MSRKFSFRAAQLEFARQVETFDHIEKFIKSVASAGYNHLVLYLGGRVKTASFPYHSVRVDRYSSEQIRSIVAMAAEHGLEAIPYVPLFAHMDYLLDEPELNHLAELRGGRKGRYSKRLCMICPSLPEARTFIETYVQEIAELFPSKYFLAGFDEVRDIGFCDLCRDKAHDELFLQHLLFCHQVLTQKAGKRMLIWDDMFDVYESILPKVPRDIILCAWHYDNLVDLPRGHCGGPGIDKFTLYENLGFEYIFAPAVYSCRNIETFTEYASKHNVLGGFLTLWSGPQIILMSELPNLVYCGRLWNGEEISIEEVVREMLGDIPQELITLLKAVFGERELRLSTDFRSYLFGPLNEREYHRVPVLNTLFSMLEREFLQADSSNEPAYSILEDLFFCVAKEQLLLLLREQFSKLYSSRMQPDFPLLKSKLQALLDLRLKQWRRVRCNLDCSHVQKYFAELLAMIEQVEEESKEEFALLKIRSNFTQNTVFTAIKWQGEESWEELPAAQTQAGFAREPAQSLIPVKERGIPVAVRIETQGTGMALCFIEFCAKNGKRYVPEKILRSFGEVLEPEVILENSIDWCRLGGYWEQEARRKYPHLQAIGKRNGLEIALKED